MVGLIIIIIANLFSKRDFNIILPRGFFSID
jgi:hypothetical protein